MASRRTPVVRLQHVRGHLRSRRLLLLHETAPFLRCSTRRKDMTEVANFSGDCGECGTRGGYFKASCPGGMQTNQSATVNGSSPQNCVVANDGGTVLEIMLQPIAGIYDYQIRVYAQGPVGAFS